MDIARRLWTTVEPLHAVVYFAPQVRAAGVAAGLRGFWDTYFALRAAPLGAVAAGGVVASFAGFEPSMVGRALPSAWSRASVQTCLATRSAVCAAVLREVGVSVEGCAAAVAALAPVVVVEPTGRPLGAANAALPLPADPVAALWQVATTLREHRGDGHVAALVVAGLSGLDAMLLQVARGRFPAEGMRVARGWSPRQWSAAHASLVARGLLVADGLSDAGAAVLASVEEMTDSLAWQGDPVAVETAIEALASSVAAVWACGVLPADNPIGVRDEARAEGPDVLQ
jgi:helix-turn-helix protein